MYKSLDASFTRFSKLLFDVSGTLWDDREQVFIANYKVLENEGYTEFPTGEPITMDGLICMGLGSCVELFRYFGLKGSDQQLTQKYIEALDEVANEYPVKLYDGVEELVNSLDEKVPKIVISAHPQHRLEKDLDKSGLYDSFRDIIGNCHNKKDTIEEYVDSLVPYIGDTKSDIIHARNAGAIPLAVTYGYGQKHELLAQEPFEHFPCPFSLRDYLIDRI